MAIQDRLLSIPRRSCPGRSPSSRSNRWFTSAEANTLKHGEAMQTEFEDVITCLREDDNVLAEMLGIASEMDSCLPQGEAGGDIDDGPDFIRPVNHRPRNTNITTKHG